MKTRFARIWNSLRLVTATTFAGLFVSTVLGQSPPVRPHAFGLVSRLPDGALSVQLHGQALSTFRSYFDIYPVESSTDLANWEPLATLVRTNSSTNDLTFLDLEAAGHAQRFYRMPTNHFITPFPKPTGPYPVGTFPMVFNDPTRTNRFGVKTNGTFMATVWYPAERRSGAWPSLVFHPKLAKPTESVFGGSEKLYLNAAGSASDHAMAAAKGGPFPVLIYSHGFFGFRQENVDKFEDLASHGYVVFSADHDDCSLTVFPDGRLYEGDGLTGDVRRKIADIRFVLDQLTRIDESDKTLRSRLDLERVGIFGWSMGAGAAAEICRTNERVKVAAMLDGGPYDGVPNVVKSGLKKPFLCINSAAADSAAVSRITSTQQLFNISTNSAYTLRIRETDHLTFALQAFVESPTAIGRRKATLAMRSCLVSFFDKHLKGVDDHLLDDPTKTHSVIFDFKKK